MSLPAFARHRWGLKGSGEVGYLDRSNAIVSAPEGVMALRRQLLAASIPAGDDLARSRKMRVSVLSAVHHADTQETTVDSGGCSALSGKPVLNARLVSPSPS